MKFTSKFKIGAWVKGCLPEKGNYTFGEIYAVTFYADQVTYSIKNGDSPDCHFIIPENKMEAA